MKIMSEREQTVSYMIQRFEKELKYALILRQFDSNIQHIISDEYFNWCKKMLAEVRQARVELLMVFIGRFSPILRKLT